MTRCLFAAVLKLLGYFANQKYGTPNLTMLCPDFMGFGAGQKVKIRVTLTKEVQPEKQMKCSSAAFMN